MIDTLRITVLVENTAGARAVLAEHGFALWVEAADQRILFDTGQGMALKHNADVLGVDLATATDVVLSHGHFDHTGGLPGLLDKLSGARLFAHPDCFLERYSRGADGKGRPVGSPITDPQAVRDHVAELVLTTERTDLTDDIWATGPIPRQTDFEDTGGAFFLDEACTTPDTLPDDQALVVRTSQGLIVLLGCAHSGLVNTLDHVARQAPGESFHAVLGGMHLLTASVDRLERTIAALERHAVQRVGPAHCTGRGASNALWERFGQAAIPCLAGTRITFG